MIAPLGSSRTIEPSGSLSSFGSCLEAAGLNAGSGADELEEAAAGEGDGELDAAATGTNGIYAG